MVRAPSQPAACPVCQSTGADTIIRREATPIFQNTIYRSAQAARAALRGRLDMRHCQVCGLVWNAAFDPACIVYSTDYDNSQIHSDAFRAHLADRLERIMQSLPDTGSRALEVVEIGCGQGDFLIDLATAITARRPVRATGFDPAYRGGRTLPAGVMIVPAYFNAASLAEHDLAPDVIVSRHSIEHVSDPVGFLAAMRACAGDAGSMRLFLETPDNSWILAYRAFHDFFYEHCSILSYRSMALALARAGFLPTRIESCFGGQYLWAEAVSGEPERRAAHGCARSLDAYVARWRQTIEAGGRRVALWGAGAKGATFALLVDADATRIVAVVDKNPGKQGCFLPLTGHRIVAPASMVAQRIDLILVLNPNYEAEIRAEVAGLGLAPDIVIVD